MNRTIPKGTSVRSYILSRATEPRAKSDLSALLEEIRERNEHGSSPVRRTALLQES